MYTRHSVLDQFCIQLLPALLNSPKEPITACLVALVAPFLEVLLNQALVVEFECQLGVDSLLGTLPLERDRGFEDVFLCQAELHRLRCGGVEHVAFCWPKRAAVQHMLTKNEEDLFQRAYFQLCSRRTASAWLLMLFRPRAMLTGSWKTAFSA